MRPIPYLRVYDASIINYLKYEVLPVYFTERIVNEPLVYSDSLGGYVTQASMVPNPTSMGRGWALFDEVVVGNRVIVDATTEQSTQVTVSGADTYQIDYPGGRIINPNTAPMSVSYSWYYVSLVEGWPGSEPPPTPIVAVDVDRTVKEGYQLGGGTKDILHGSVYVFASSETEKKEITEAKQVLDVEAAEEIAPSLYIGSVTEGMKKRLKGSGITTEEVKGFTEKGFPTIRTPIKMVRGEAEQYLEFLYIHDGKKGEVLDKILDYLVYELYFNVKFHEDGYETLFLENK